MMATDLGSTRTAAGKYDGAIADKLTQAEGRIRTLDLAMAFFGFVAITLGYAFLVALLDRQWELSAGTRQVGFLAYLAVSLLFLAWTAGPPLLRRINPYYAARQVEQTLPNAKNSVVNWLDVQGQELPSSIRASLGQRAAKDLAKADLEKAFSGRRATHAGAIAALAAFIVVCLFFNLGPAPFYSLMARAFAPFGFGNQGIATRTQLTIVKPEDGNAIVPIGQPVNIAVRVEGKEPDPKSPDAVKLRYRYQDTDPYMERALHRTVDGEWVVTVPPGDVQSGFFYHVTGGDGRTAEYRISVRPNPSINDVMVTYHYRPYVGREPEVRRERELNALRGTEAELLVKTNRAVKEGRLEFRSNDNKREKTVVAEPVDGDPQAFRVRLVLDEDGGYRLRYSTAEGENYSDPVLYTVKVIPDQPPTDVKLTKPGLDIELPANGILRVEGTASDDVGVKSLTLMMKVVNGPELQGKPYRSEDGLRLAAGGYPTNVPYKDYVELSAVRTRTGEKYTLVQGMEVEYWLEARDGCDYPDPKKPGITNSTSFRVRIKPPIEEAQAKQEQNKAANEQQQHDRKQDDELKRQNEERKEQNDRQKEANKEQQKGGEGGKGDKSEKKSDNGQGDKEAAKDKGSDEKPKDGAKKEEGKSGEKNGEQKKQDEKTREMERKIKEALDKKEQEKKDGEKGKAKEDNPKPAESKGDKGTREGTQSGENRSQPEAKPEAPKDGDRKPGQEKNAGKPGDEKQPSTTKEEGKREPKEEGKPGENKGTDPKAHPEQKQGENKPESKPDTGAKPGQRSESKPEGKPQGNDRPGQEKPQPDKAEKQPAPSENKNAGATDKKNERPSGEKKEQPAPTEKAGEKSAGKPDEMKNNPPASPKDNPRLSTEEKKGGEATSKPSAAKNETAKTDRAETKGDRKKETSPGSSASEPKPEDAKPSDAEKAGHDLNSSDPGKRGEAQKKLEEMKDKARDPGTREAAQKELDRAKSEEHQAENAKPQDAEKAGKDLQSNDPQKREDAHRQLEQMKEKAKDPQARKAAGKELEKAPKPAEEGRSDPKEAKPKDVEKTARGLKSDDPKKRDEARQQLEQMKDKAKDPETRKAAEEELKKSPPPEERKVDPKKAKPEDARKEGENLRNGDPKKRDEARQQLEQMKQKADDPQTREEATKELEKRTPKPGNAKGSKPDEKTNPPLTEVKPKKGDQGEPRKDEGKKNDESKSESKQQGKPQEQGTERAMGKTKPEPGTPKDEGDHSEALPPPDKKPHDSRDDRATELQLEDFKKIDKDILKDLKMSDEDLKKFERDLKDLRRREATEAEKKADPKNKSNLGSMGGSKPVTPAGPGTTSDLGNGGRLKPPPGYGDAWRNFTKMQSQPPAKDK
jgi:hypothetical protein